MGLVSRYALVNFGRCFSNGSIGIVGRSLSFGHSGTGSSIGSIEVYFSLIDIKNSKIIYLTLILY